MIIDSSALVAIYAHEPERQAFLDAVIRESTSMSAANWLETCLVLDNRPTSGLGLLDELVEQLRIRLEPVTLDQVRIAREAHHRFGRGSGSPAKLNFGDCFAYALAITTGDCLLFNGDDFVHTDVRSAVEELGLD